MRLKINYGMALREYLFTTQVIDNRTKRLKKRIMKCNELMIGDIIKHNDDFVRVADIGSAVCIADYLDPTGHENAKYSTCYNRAIEVISMFTPIELTNEILLMNGFEKSKECDFFYLNEFPFDLMNSKYNEDPTCYGVMTGNSTVKYIKYVHQLQQILRIFGNEKIADNFKVE